MNPSSLLGMWNRMAPLPGGKWIFSILLRRVVPYSGTTRPRVLELSAGHAVLAVSDRRGLRNHLNSVHAVAIANAAELASGLALTTALPVNVRGIVLRLEVEYLKKARGPLVAESSCAIPLITGTMNFDVTATVRDAESHQVATARVTWRLSARPATPP